MRCAIFYASAIVLTVSVESASAHYLWVQVDGKAGVANLYFEGGPAAGDGKYLDPFIKLGKMWVQTSGSTKAAEVKMSEVKKGKKRWLTATVSESVPRSVDADDERFYVGVQPSCERPCCAE